jgi:hypothetical protein
MNGMKEKLIERKIMTAFGHRKYIWSKPWSTHHHHWELIGPEGGVHFHVSIFNENETCGLEFHHSRLAWQRITGRNEAPHHIDCPLLGEPCWHDGTSLYATETL